MRLTMCTVITDYISHTSTSFGIRMCNFENNTTVYSLYQLNFKYKIKHDNVKILHK